MCPIPKGNNNAFSVVFDSLEFTSPFFFFEKKKKLIFVSQFNWFSLCHKKCQESFASYLGISFDIFINLTLHKSFFYNHVMKTLKIEKILASSILSFFLKIISTFRKGTLSCISNLFSESTSYIHRSKISCLKKSCGNLLTV